MYIWCPLRYYVVTFSVFFAHMGLSFRGIMLESFEVSLHLRNTLFQSTMLKSSDVSYLLRATPVRVLWWNPLEYPYAYELLPLGSYPRVIRGILTHTSDSLLGYYAGTIWGILIPTVNFLWNIMSQNHKGANLLQRQIVQKGETNRRTCAPLSEH